MIRNRRTFFRHIAAALVVAAALGPSTARADQGFQNWINSFYATAAKSGISQATYRKAFAGVKTPDPAVIEKANYQPEFKHKIWEYIDSRVNPYTRRIGQEMAAKHTRTLDAVERHFGVDRTILLAIWSMESNYGAVLQKDDRLHYVPRALATLAYADPKRAKFAKTQLIAALKILQSGDITPRELTGSWAGAMGHTQFIPTSYLLYAVDADGNGHRDIWNSVPDALATAANLLRKNGWQPGETWGYEIVAPANAAKYSGQTKTLGQWAALGFVRPDGRGFRNSKMRAELKLPGGGKGPGFLMTRNFFVIKRYNASDSYALGVGLLADQIAGYAGMQQRWPRPDGSLDISEKFELQNRLKELGYYDGEVDGNFGSGSKAAIQAFQAQNGLPTDGEPTQHLLRVLRK
ncbi:lytic transglycosylase [Sinorhizobium fredii USDA 205]|uniref:Lytic murein transglycosylase n=1 Tax=Rhizobium fredii TaxID=380 RepID=A0A2A6LZP5_RHIFR|nr:lytic murein transglycosylase [Sinorhizobium fredii]ASY70440.1 Membrane-bound lytic murein transglycosylase B precursor [Sinorhizobium fredii CCBAU 83666]KSV89124.1 lytic transglycosylase [Sinorhizobium fredii USDA 205]MQW97500.1 lytic murein transglycosylase [Sinorhizobium fredii]MQX12130.1 lytic murein transglycosylase [Sinorhizobium fredii]PDT47848.1 lytic murein transglycosylase [Sinorhizobium fredii]